MNVFDPPPGVHYCALCECPLPINSSDVVCGACAKEWQAWGELRQAVATGMRTDWPVKGISHAKMQRRREGPMSRSWEFEVGDVNFWAQPHGPDDGDGEDGSHCAEGEQEEDEE